MKRHQEMAGTAMLVLAACGPDFVPAEEIDRLRVLGISTRVIETPELAWPNVDEDLELAALATLEGEGSPSLTWRFCPLAFGSAGDFECVFDEEDFRDAVITLVTDAVAEADELDLDTDALAELLTGLDFDLGTGPSVVFNLTDLFLGDARSALEAAVEAGVESGILSPEDAANLMPASLVAAALEQFCEDIQTQEFPEFVERPECNGTFEFRVDVIATNEDEDESLEARRFFTVIYDPESPFAVPNRNPEAQLLCAIDLGQFVREGEAVPSAQRLLETRCVLDNVFVLGPEAAPAPAFFDEDIRVVIPDLCVVQGTASEIDEECIANAEFFLTTDPDGETVEATENLVLSWFVDTGDLDRSRTAFALADENSPLSEAQTNEWTPPARIDFDDDSGLPLDLFVVVRDGRGGRAFLRGAFRIEDRPEEDDDRQ
ncbi:MAG: hypothetical protein ACFB9M_17640 [Myxococcota bacterium]